MKWTDQKGIGAVLSSAGPMVEMWGEQGGVAGGGIFQPRHSLPF